LNVRILRSSHRLIPHPVNYYLVEYRGYRILVDTGLDGVDGVDWILVTHYHWDHTFGLTRMSGGKLCISRESLESMDSGRVYESIKDLARAAGYGGDISGLRPYSILYDDIRASLDRYNIYMLEECPLSDIIEVLDCRGHSMDHVCYIIGDRLFLGDNYVPYTESATLASPLDYMKSMTRILGSDWRHAYPGHGEPGTRMEFAVWVTNVLVRKVTRMLSITLHTSSDGTPFNRLVEKIYGDIKSCYQWMENLRRVCILVLLHQ